MKHDRRNLHKLTINPLLSEKEIIKTRNYYDISNDFGD